MSVIACKKCVMDNVYDFDFHIDDCNECNYCNSYYTGHKLRTVYETENDFRHILNSIKKSKRGQYDCVIGVSGGVDSTYVAHLAVKHGLKPLAIHFDNGWNSKASVKNIKSVIDKLKIDLITYVVNYSEFIRIQKAFLQAKTPDGEIPTDHGILATLFKFANKFNIRYILNGNNYVTESIFPKSWAYGYLDTKYIKDVVNKFENVKFKTYPFLTLKWLAYYTYVKQIKNICILNYIDYNKKDALRILKENYGFTEYESKHYESNYTKFYQGYYLFNKFGIDKRKGHLSNLILKGEISRNDAKKILIDPPIPKQEEDNLLDYVSNKLDVKVQFIKDLIEAENLTYKSYRNNAHFDRRVRKLAKLLRSYNLYPK